LKNELQKRYGPFTAICMVAGIVIGSGVFFKAQDILNYTEGDMPLGILAWLIGGAVMVVCASTFAGFATKYEKVNGLIDYAEATVGKRFAYITGWYVSVMYYPALASVLSWAAARYTIELFGSYEVSGGLCMTLAAVYLCLAYALNTLAPALAGKIQVSATVIKLVPLVIMAIVGGIAGILNGNLNIAFSSATIHSGGSIDSIFAGVVAASFAYEGWIVATSVNAEIKNAKRNLPLALIAGTFIIIAVYIFYYIGLTGAASVNALRSEGAPAAFKNLFGNIGGNILTVFIAISCLGTLNGVMLACTRGLYSVAVRNTGPAPEMLSQVDNMTGMPTNSSVMGLLFCVLWLFYFYGATLADNIFGLLSFDSSELPVITIYGFYIPIFIMYIKKLGKRRSIKNCILPVLSVIASLFMLFSAFYAHGIVPFLKELQKDKFSFPILFYFIIFCVIMGVGMFFYRKNGKGNVY